MGDREKKKILEELIQTGQIPKKDFDQKNEELERKIKKKVKSQNLMKGVFTLSITENILKLDNKHFE